MRDYETLERWFVDHRNRIKQERGQNGHEQFQACLLFWNKHLPTLIFIAGTWGSALFLGRLLRASPRLYQEDQSYRHNWRTNSWEVKLNEKQENKKKKKAWAR